MITETLAVYLEQAILKDFIHYQTCFDFLSTRLVAIQDKRAQSAMRFKSARVRSVYAFPKALVRSQSQIDTLEFELESSISFHRYPLHYPQILALT